MERWLNGNPAQAVILENAKEAFEKGEELRPVEKVVLREWVIRMKSRQTALFLKAQNTFLNDEEYADLAALTETLDKYEGVL
jgi:hypothetical protein